MTTSNIKINIGIELVMLICILVLGLLFRLYKIDNPVADWHSWRQADTASVSRIFSNDGIDLLHPKYHDVSLAQTGIDNPEGYRFVEFPLYNAVNSSLYNLFPSVSLEIWGRLISIFSSLISTLFIYLLGKRYIGSIGGLASAFFFAVLPFNVYFSRVILPDPTAVMLGVGTLWFFVQFIDNEKSKFMYLSSALFALSILVKPFTIFYGLPLLILSIQKFGLGGTIKSKKLWSFVLITLSPFILWRLWMTQFPEGIPHTKWAFNGDGIRFRPAFWRWIVGERIGRMILGLWGVVVAAFGVVSLKSKNAFIFWFLAASALYVVVFATANVRHDYYQIMIIPSICLLLGLGVNFLSSPPKPIKRYVTIPLLAFCVLMGLGMSAYDVKGFYNINHYEIIEAGSFVDQNIPKDAMVIAPYNKDTAFLYQTGRSGWPYVLESVEDLIEKGADYYVSVNYDQLTLDTMDKYEIVEENSKYVVVKLN